MALLTPALTAASTTDTPRAMASRPSGEDVTELRLALVCDGGVSLAIYIHGVTKELQNLVYAARAHDAVLDGTDTVDSVRQYLSPIQLAYFRALQASPKHLSVVIDVISGTSAGGINGVILAKALSRNLSQDPMTSMWLDLADLKKLAHRHLPGEWGAIVGSLVALPFHITDEGWAPLDGDLMGTWLLDALAAMDENPGALPRPSLLPADHDLDLFVTTTDLRGYERFFPSPDGGRGEHDRNNRKVFHFSSGTGADAESFGSAANPGLAFAARCTSSFPGAFKPVGLGDFAEVAARHPGADFDVARFSSTQLAEYPLAGEDPLSTYFADGGLLDNSPFDHTIAAIAAKSAQGRVDRRIVHINPDPGDWPAVGDPTAALVEQTEPSWAGGLKTALGVRSSQSLVGDLNDLRKLNRTIDNVGTITTDLQSRIDDELHKIAGAYDVTVPTLDQARTWAAAVHAKVPELAGSLNTLTYQRLKVATVSEMFADDLAGMLKYPAESQQATFLRSVFAAWFEKSEFYSTLSAQEIADFLDDADLPYRERRLRFLIAGVNKLFGTAVGDDQLSALRHIKTRAWTMLNTLLDFRADTARSLAGPPTLFLRADQLGGPAAFVDPDGFVTAHAPDMANLVGAYRNALATYSNLNPTDQLWSDFSTYTKDLATNEQADLLGRYLGFPLWDALIFPVIALSQLPQLSQVTLQRISPLDATLLHPTDGAGTPKLRGTAVHNFGGFFDREWRENDYLWGRLDTAELIMDMIGLPGPNNYTDAALGAVLDAEESALRTVRDLIGDLRRQLKARAAVGAQA